MGGRRDRTALGESDLLDRLAARHPAPEWALFAQVRDAAGFAANRTLDAIAMNTWPSRGLEIHGFECKSTRSDWLREKADPSKAETFARFCDRWWLVVSDEEIVRDGELPPTWGLLVPRGTGLVAKVEAPKMEPIALGRHQIAVLLRRATEIASRPPTTAEVEARIQAAHDASYKAGERDAGFNAEHAKREAGNLRKSIDDFERASGVRLNPWDAGDIGEAVRFVLQSGLEVREQQLQGLLGTARRIVGDLEKQLATLPATEKSTGTEG